MMSLMKHALGLAMVFSMAGIVSADALLIEGGTIHPLTAEPFVGNVAVVDGRITELGPGVAAPEGAQRIDAAGLHVYPGLFDAIGTLGLTEIGSVPATDDQAELGMYNAHLKAAAAVHPASELIPVARENGITHAVVAPRVADEGVIAGQAALIQLDGWTVEEMSLDDSVAMVIDWPQIVTRSFDFSTFSFKESPFEDAKEAAEKKQNELRDWVDAARQYRRAMAVGSPRADLDPRLAALASCLDGGMKVIIRADSKRDIEAAIAFAEEAGFDMILASGRDAWKLKESLAEKDIPVLLGRTQALPPEEDDPYDRPFSSAAELRAAGVRIAFGSGAGGAFSGGPHSARNLPYEAATAAAFGLAEEDALRALTLWPAEIFGVGGELGSIDAGKIANLIVCDGNPLDIRSNVEHLIIAGREVSTDNMHRSLFERYRSRPLPAGR